MVKNYIEILVDKVIEEMLKDKGYFKCSCSNCIDNIKAIALNNIKPYYITSKEGEVYAEYQNMDIQFKADIVREITKAKKIVERNPKHNIV